MVSKKGFQRGAKQYAKAYGISLKELRAPEIGETFIGNMVLFLQLTNNGQKITILLFLNTSAGWI